MKTHAEYEAEQIGQHLIGAKIINAVVDNDKEYFGFNVLIKGRTVTCWINQDPEGNGPGHIEIEI